MTVKTKPVTSPAIKQTIEGRDGRMLASFYADDAVVRSIAAARRASRVKYVVRGDRSVLGHLQPLTTHKVDTTITGNHFALHRLHLSRWCDGAACRRLNSGRRDCTSRRRVQA